MPNEKTSTKATRGSLVPLLGKTKRKCRNWLIDWWWFMMCSRCKYTCCIIKYSCMYVFLSVDWSKLLCLPCDDAWQYIHSIATVGMKSYKLTPKICSNILGKPTVKLTVWNTVTSPSAIGACIAPGTFATGWRRLLSNVTLVRRLGTLCGTLKVHTSYNPQDSSKWFF